MKICTITCHDVYNHGASLQAYALMKYLINRGHEVEIIDYKPHYLSNHYNLLSIGNPKWNRNIFSKSLYLILKLPGRIVSLRRKSSFDKFTSKFLKLTSSRYKSNEELKGDLPNADAYICGSDQIWNSLHKNGRDPAFYLDFVPEGKIKMSYAASFATKSITDKYKPMVKERVKRLNGISVRETSGVEILKKLNINNAVTVVDPVFLLDTNDWDRMSAKKFYDKYILVYDFDNSNLIKKIAINISKEKGYKIYSINPGKLKYADKYFSFHGPETFVSLIKNAQFIISNSFHAAVFSIIYEKDFAIVNRDESINTRMQDLLDDLKLNKRLLDKNFTLEQLMEKIDYEETKKILKSKIDFSEKYLTDLLVLNNKVRNYNEKNFVRY